MPASKLFPVFLPLLYTALLTAQPTTKGCIDDLNHDDYTDTLAFANDPVPCDYNYLVTFTDGKTGAKVGVPREDYCRCHIRSVVPIPPTLWLPKNANVLALIKAGLLQQERATPDPSFAWILRGLENRCELEDHAYFELVIDPGIERHPGKVVLPNTYSVPLSGKPFARLLTGHYSADVATDKGFATYYGHNHYQRREQSTDSVVLVATTADLQIYRTSHGLFAQSPIKHHWLFVTDHALTGAPDKLRWASIGDVAIWQDRLLVLQHRLPVSGGTAVFLIDLATGRTGRLRHDLLGEPDDRINFAVVGESLELRAVSPGGEDKKEADLVFLLETLQDAFGSL